MAMLLPPAPPGAPELGLPLTLLVVDVQERLARVMPGRDETVERCVRLVRGFRTFLADAGMGFAGMALGALLRENKSVATAQQSAQSKMSVAAPGYG